MKKIQLFLNFLNFFRSPVSRIVPKQVKCGPLEVFQHPFFCKIDKKMKGGPLEIFAKKVSQSRKKFAQKNFGHGGTRTYVILLVRPRKSRSDQVAVK